jgi:outer membrane protein assembly factor BamB
MDTLRPRVDEFRVRKVFCGLKSPVFARFFPLAAVLGSLHAAPDTNWPRFRGPNGSGQAAAVTKLPEEWTEEASAWSVPLPGEGNSSPVIWGERVFITSAVGRGERRVVICFDIHSGKQLWRKDVASVTHKRHKMNSYATSSPAADEDGLYVLWGQPDRILVVAYTHDGKESWRKDLGPYKSGHGYGVSPIVADGKLVIGNDQEGGNSIVALDTKSGRELWNLPRKALRATYSTPCIRPRDDGGNDVIVADWQQGVSAIDLVTGRQRWSSVVFDVDDKQRAIGSPIIWNDLVIATCGFVTGRKRLVALRPGVTGSSGVAKVFQLDKGVPHVPTPLAHDGRLYLWSDSGMVTCLRLPGGKVLYDRERTSARGKIFSSPVAVGGRIVNFSTTGDVVVLQAGDDFKVLQEAKLPAGATATPAIAGGRFIVRTKSKLLAW